MMCLKTWVHTTQSRVACCSFRDTLYGLCTVVGFYKNKRTLCWKSYIFHFLLSRKNIKNMSWIWCSNKVLWCSKAKLILDPSEKGHGRVGFLCQIVTIANSNVFVVSSSLVLKYRHECSAFSEVSTRRIMHFMWETPSLYNVQRKSVHIDWLLNCWYSWCDHALSYQYM